MTPRTPASRPLRVALLGLGTVGGEVARGLLARGEDLARAAGGRPLHLVAVGLRDPDRPRAVEVPRAIPRTADLAALVVDGGVDVVVELIGGLEPAGELVRAALAGGRSVVTANKALLARRGVELEAEARRTGASLRFEAAVGGGIPVLGPLAADLGANRWSSITGIVNGTTNFILSAMTEAGSGYEAVLAEAQARGYAEADPSGDLEGRDAADKLTLLARLAFGAWPDVTATRRTPPAVEGDGAPGITGVTAGQIAAAADLDLVLKLIAQARRAPNGGIAATVLPCVVPAGSALGRTGGVTNMVELSGEPLGRVRFSGPGAGGAATSSAVLGDLIAIARGLGSTWAGLPPADLAADGVDPLSGPRRWFHLRPDGGGSLSEPSTLAVARGTLAAEGVRGTLYPLVDD